MSEANILKTQLQAEQTRNEFKSIYIKELEQEVARCRQVINHLSTVSTNESDKTYAQQFMSESQERILVAQTRMEK